MSAQDDPSAKPQVQFSQQDQALILQSLQNQPLQNLAAARVLAGLIERFNGFCAQHLAPQRPPTKGKNEK